MCSCSFFPALHASDSNSRACAAHVCCRHGSAASVLPLAAQAEQRPHRRAPVACCRCRSASNDAAVTLLRPLGGILTFLILLAAAAFTLGAYGARQGVPGLAMPRRLACSPAHAALPQHWPARVGHLPCSCAAAEHSRVRCIPPACRPEPGPAAGVGGRRGRGGGPGHPAPPHECRGLYRAGAPPVQSGCCHCGPCFTCVPQPAGGGAGGLCVARLWRCGGCGWAIASPLPPRRATLPSLPPSHLPSLAGCSSRLDRL